MGGVVIPESDKNELEKAGITGNFGPGTSLDKIIEHIVKNVKYCESLLGALNAFEWL